MRNRAVIPCRCPGQPRILGYTMRRRIITRNHLCVDAWFTAMHIADRSRADGLMRL